MRMHYKVAFDASVVNTLFLSIQKLKNKSTLTCWTPAHSLMSMSALSCPPSVFWNHKILPWYLLTHSKRVEEPEKVEVEGHRR